MRPCLPNLIRTGSLVFLLMSAFSDASANIHIGQSCETQWQILNNSLQNKDQTSYAEFLVKCHTQVSRSTVLNEQSTKTKINETVILKSVPATLPTIKISGAKKLKLQKQCLAEWKATVIANNLKTHPSWRKFLRLCKERLKSKG